MLLELFLDSLFAIVLGQDPSTENIEIEVPIVTPDILDVIKYMVDTGKTPIVEPKENWRQAGRYLLMDVITAMSDPEYPVVGQKTRLN